MHYNNYDNRMTSVPCKSPIAATLLNKPHPHIGLEVHMTRMKQKVFRFTHKRCYFCNRMFYFKNSSDI